MNKHFEREIEKLKQHLFSLCALVEESLREATYALLHRDAQLAQKIIDTDVRIDHTELDVEEECLKTLALHQPVAIDLRFIVAVLKINNDLERIGDMAVNIAERVVFLASEPPIDIPFDFAGMAEKTQTMLRKSLDALVNMDTNLAREVIIADDEVDAINREMYSQVKAGMRANPDNIDALIHLLSVSRHIERIADLTNNIAEDVIYMVEGEIVRHKTEDYLAQKHQG